MAQRLKTDWILFFTILALVCFGLVMVYSSSSVIAEIKFHVSDKHFCSSSLGWAVFSFFRAAVVQAIGLPPLEHSQIRVCGNRHCAPAVAGRLYHRQWKRIAGSTPASFPFSRPNSPSPPWRSFWPISFLTALGPLTTSIRCFPSRYPSAPLHSSWRSPIWVPPLCWSR